MTANFDVLRANYPLMPKDSLFDELGGQWPDLKTNANYNNTCAIRLSHSFNKSGDLIPSKFKEALDGKGRNIILKVSTFNKFAVEKYGEFSWGISKPPGGDFPIDQLPSMYKGLIVYHADFGHATGHFDLWTGSSFVGSGNVDDIREGFDIAVWNLSSIA